MCAILTLPLSTSWSSAHTGGMKLLEALRAEHALIARVALSLHTFVEMYARGEKVASREDGDGYVRFFRLYVGRHHHGREEMVLFPALVEQTEAPADRGPLRVMVEDHHTMSSFPDELTALLDGDRGSAEMAKLTALSNGFARALLRHIDVENGVLFPECEARFGRACVQELPDHGPDVEEEAAAAEGAALVSRHEPAHFPDLIIGGSCTTCEAFGTRCDGLEREWSSDAEWDDMLDRVG